eukprot:1151142-Pelagomonas_calceolata.AAC.1
MAWLTCGCRAHKLGRERAEKAAHLRTASGVGKNTKALTRASASTMPSTKAGTRKPAHLRAASGVGKHTETSMQDQAQKQGQGKQRTCGQPLVGEEISAPACSIWRGRAPLPSRCGRWRASPAHRRGAAPASYRTAPAFVSKCLLSLVSNRREGCAGEALRLRLTGLRLHL